MSKTGYRARLRNWLPVLVVLALCAPGRAGAGDTFYMAVFSTQTEPNLPRFSHTFALFARVASDATNRPCRVEVRTISWLPKSLVLRPWRLTSEPGVNLRVEDTIRWALANRAQISVWGPFQIRPELYRQALRQAEFLESGGLAYKVIDMRTRPYEAIDCIRAVSGLDVSRGILDTGTARGDAASYLTLVHLSGWIVDSMHRHEWLLQHIGLNQYPLERRGWARDGQRLEYEPLPIRAVTYKSWP